MQTSIKKLLCLCFRKYKLGILPVTKYFFVLIKGLIYQEIQHIKCMHLLTKLPNTWRKIDSKGEVDESTIVAGNTSQYLMVQKDKKKIRRDIYHLNNTFNHLDLNDIYSQQMQMQNAHSQVHMEYLYRHQYVSL